MCNVALSYGITDYLLSISGGKSDGGALTFVTDADDSLTEMLHVAVL